MQSASALQVTIRSFGVWNAALALLGMWVVAVAACWSLSWHETPMVWSGAACMALALVGLAGIASLVRRQPIVLRWDGQRWHLTDVHRGLRDQEVFDLRITLDLGGWVLLRYRAHGLSPRPWGSGWLPVQRYGIETEWHLLRCALHARGAAEAVPGALNRRAQHG